MLVTLGGPRGVGEQNLFGAAPSAAGYLYQARLALALTIPYWNSAPGMEISIEQLDDVAFHADGEPVQLLQAKHHLKQSASLSDTSPEIWKTLRVWATAAASEPSLPSRVKFILVTTGVAPPGSAASLLRPANLGHAGESRDLKTAQELLATAAGTSRNVALAPAFDAFLSLTPQMQLSLLSAIEVLDRHPSIVDLGNVLEDGLRLIGPRGKAPEARELLEGWWWPRVCAALAARSPQSIAIAEIEAKLDDIRDVLKRDALVATFEHVDPPADEAARYDDFRFVRQLHAIGIGPNRLWNAKRDFYRAFAQRSQWLREHAVLDDELQLFEARLVEEWEAHFEPMREAHADTGTDEAVLRLAGGNVYGWVETDARFPLRSLIRRFLNVGSYHILADDLRVGWHRDYRSLCGGDDC